MPNINQLYTLLNQVTADATQGTASPVAANLTGIISLGNELQSSANFRDNWIKALLDRIGRTVVDNRPYKRSNMRLMREAFEYGCILQKIYTAPIQAVENTQWNVVDGQSYDPWTVHKTDSKEKLFTGIDTWAFEYTVPNEQLFTAFTSETALGAFITSIYEAADTSYEMYLENMERLVNANFMAEKIKYASSANSGLHKVNLLEEYNSRYRTSLTSATAFNDENWLKYAVLRINMVLNFMKNIGTMFNTEGYYRHTPKDRARILMLNEFVMSASYFMQSDTFHVNLVQLPNFAGVDFWQYPGSDFEFKDTSAINVVTSSGTAIQQSGIICCISDMDAIGMFIDKRSTDSIYNPKITSTNYFDRSNVSYLNNMSENGTVFVVEDPAPVEVTIPQSSKVSATSKVTTK